MPPRPLTEPARIFLDALDAYRAQFGDCDVPASYFSPSGYPLGGMVRGIQSQHMAHPLAAVALRRREFRWTDGAAPYREIRRAITVLAREAPHYADLHHCVPERRAAVVEALALVRAEVASGASSPALAREIAPYLYSPRLQTWGWTWDDYLLPPFERRAEPPPPPLAPGAARAAHPPVAAALRVLVDLSVLYPCPSDVVARGVIADVHKLWHAVRIAAHPGAPPSVSAELFTPAHTPDLSRAWRDPRALHEAAASADVKWRGDRMASWAAIESAIGTLERECARRGQLGLAPQRPGSITARGTLATESGYGVLLPHHRARVESLEGFAWPAYTSPPRDRVRATAPWDDAMSADDEEVTPRVRARVMAASLAPRDAQMSDV